MAGEVVVRKWLIAEAQTPAEAGGGEQKGAALATRLPQVLAQAAGQQIERAHFASHALQRRLAARRGGERQEMDQPGNRPVLPADAPKESLDGAGIGQVRLDEIGTSIVGAGVVGNENRLLAEVRQAARHLSRDAAAVVGEQDSAARQAWARARRQRRIHQPDQGPLHLELLDRLRHVAVGGWQRRAVARGEGAVEIVEDGAQALQAGELFHLEARSRAAVAAIHGLGQAAQDLHALDRVDPQVRFQILIEPQHVLGIASPLADQVQELGGDPGAIHLRGLRCAGRRILSRHRGGRIGRPDVLRCHHRRLPRHGRRGSRPRPLQVAGHHALLRLQEFGHQLLVAEHHLRRFVSGHEEARDGKDGGGAAVRGHGTGDRNDSLGARHWLRAHECWRGRRRRGRGGAGARLAEQDRLRSVQRPVTDAIDDPCARRQLEFVGLLPQARQVEIAQRAPRVQAIELDRHPGDEKPAEQVLKLGEARPALEVGSDRDVRLLGEDLPDETGQHPLWSDFDEDARARPVHGENFLVEEDRGDEMLGEQRRDGGRVTRIRRGGGVREHWASRSREADLRQSPRERPARLSHQRRVKAARDGDLLPAHPLRLGPGQGRFHRGLRS